METALELEADAPAIGSLSAVASVAFGASAAVGGAQLYLSIAREGAPGTLSARVEAGGDVETYDLSAAPSPSWIELPDETVFVTIEAPRRSRRPGSRARRSRPS